MLNAISYDVWMYPKKYAKYVKIINVVKFEDLDDTLKTLAHFKSLKNRDKYENKLWWCYDETSVWPKEYEMQYD